MDPRWIHLRVTVGMLMTEFCEWLNANCAYVNAGPYLFFSYFFYLAGNITEVLPYGCLSESYTSMPNRGKGHLRFSVSNLAIVRNFNRQMGK